VVSNIAVPSLPAHLIAMPPQAQLPSATELWKECSMANVKILESQTTGKVILLLPHEQIPLTKLQADVQYCKYLLP
jgi:hypothetical protein